MYVRNTSETSTGFSSSQNKYYNFKFTGYTYAGGNINSLLCKNPENAVITLFCFFKLFLYCDLLISAPLLPSTTLQNTCYKSMFEACINMTIAPILPASILSQYCYQNMFYACFKVNKITIYATDISAYQSLNYWTYNISPTGDFYCPAELTIPTGISGIPSGWTRHDIN